MTVMAASSQPHTGQSPNPRITEPGKKSLETETKVAEESLRCSALFSAPGRRRSGLLSSSGLPQRSQRSLLILVLQPLSLEELIWPS